MQQFYSIPLLLVLNFINSGKSDTDLENFCKQELFNGSLAHDPPKNVEDPGKPLNVFVKIKVIDIDEIDGAHMDFRLHMYFKTFWNDSRLNRSDILTTDCSSYVWTPDVMFETAKSIQTFDTTSTAFRVEKSGLVIMTNRYSLKAGCWMNFKHYPFDTQQCLFSIVFMRTFDAVAQLRWLGDSSNPSTASAVEFSRKMEPLQYYLQQPTTHSVIQQQTYANFTHLLVNFTLERRLTGSILTIFVPSSLVVTVSWVTFWLRPEAAPARVSLSITSLLTLCTQVQQYKSQLPPVNYVTAMDIWFFFCISIVFATLLEFALSYNNYVIKREESVSQKKISQDERKFTDSQAGMSNEMMMSDKTTSASKSRCSFLRWRYFFERHGAGGVNSHSNKGIHLDRYCRNLFPLIFLAFASIYWIFYLSV